MSRQIPWRRLSEPAFMDCDWAMQAFCEWPTTIALEGVMRNESATSFIVLWSDQ